MAERFGIIRQTFGDVINVDVGTSWNESSISFIRNCPSSFFLREKRFQAWLALSIDRATLQFHCYTIPRAAFTAADESSSNETWCTLLRYYQVLRHCSLQMHSEISGIPRSLVKGR